MLALIRLSRLSTRIRQFIILWLRFSESKFAVIKANPTKGELKPLLAAFKSTDPSAKVEDSPAWYEKLLTNPGRRNVQFNPI